MIKVKLMSFYKSFFILTLVVGFSFANSSETVHKNFTILLAADMPDISDNQTGQYAQLRQLVVDTNKQTDTLFFVFGGGSIGPSAMSSFDRGSHIIDVLNSVEPDVMGVTKREFSYFEDELSLRAYEAAFPIVLSNAIDTRIMQAPDGLAKSTLVKKGNVTMGFLSIVNTRLVEEYLLKSINVIDPRKTVLLEAEKLRNEGADFILLHYSFPFDFVPELLMDKTVDIALLSDTRLQQQYVEHANSHPNNLLLKEPGQVILASFSVNNKVSKQNEIRLQSSDLILLSDIPANPAMQEQLNGYLIRLNRLLDERIGNFTAETSTRREDVRGKENIFANFVTDAMRSYANSDIAMINGGSIRGDTVYSEGSTITQRTIATELPFRSRLKVLELSGYEFQQSIEAALSKVADLKGGFPHVSGVTIEYDSKQSVGARVLSIKIGNELISEDKLYKLATTDYLAQGGDGLNELNNAKIVNLSLSENPILISDLVIQSIRLNGMLTANIEQRIVDVSSSK